MSAGGHLQHGQVSGFLKLMTFCWGDIKSRLCTFYIKSKTKPQRHVPEMLKCWVGLWPVMLVRKHMKTNFEIKLFKWEKQCPKWNERPETERSIALASEETPVRRKNSRMPLKGVSIFSPSEIYILFSHNLASCGTYKKPTSVCQNSQFYHQGWAERNFWVLSSYSALSITWGVISSTALRVYLRRTGKAPVS